MKVRTIPVFLAFMAMGFCDAVGPFVGLAKSEYTLSNTVAFLIPFVGFIMFGILSVPVGVYQAKKGKKFILLLGLVVMLVGMSIASYGLSSFILFLITVLFLGAGATIVQVAGNPLMRDVSDEGMFSRNLSLAQFIKAIGSLSGPVIPALASSLFGMSWKVIFPMYAVALVITIVAVAPLKTGEATVDASAPVTLGSCLALLKNPYVFSMVAAIFLYVGAEVCMSSGIPIYLKSAFGIEIEKVGVLGTGLFFTTLMIGRFVGGVVLNWISPRTFFVATVALSLVAMLGLFTANVSLAIAGVVLLGLGFANIFPLVFSITVDSMPEKTNELSGLMITAIVGGAFVPPLMGFLSDHTSATVGFVIPLVAMLYIGWIALRNLQRAPATR